MEPGSYFSTLSGPTVNGVYCIIQNKKASRKTSISLAYIPEQHIKPFWLNDENTAKVCLLDKKRWKISLVISRNGSMTTA